MKAIRKNRYKNFNPKDVLKSMGIIDTAEQVFILSTWCGISATSAYAVCFRTKGKPQSVSSMAGRLLMDKRYKDAIIRLNNSYDAAGFTFKNRKVELGESDIPVSKSKTYLMVDGRTKYVKIGKSLKPKVRERTLQSEVPLIRLFAICERDVEVDLHEEYASKRLRGEWFRLSKSDIDKICNDYGFILATEEDSDIVI